MFSYLRNRTSPSTRSQNRHFGTSKLRLESLETREVPATLVSLFPMKPVLIDGVLTVVGDGDHNVIEVKASKGHMEVLGEKFSMDDVKGITIKGMGGNDKITISEQFIGTTELDGGAGNDVIRGGGGSDLILGGSGNDRIYGRGGDDTISGGRGWDLVDGGSGMDQLNDRTSQDRVISIEIETETESKTNLVAYFSASDRSEIVNELVKLVNDQRFKRGLDALTLDVQLGAQADKQAEQLIDQKKVGAGTSSFNTTKPIVDRHREQPPIKYPIAADHSVFVKAVPGRTSAEFAQSALNKLLGDGSFRKALFNSATTHLGIGIGGDSWKGCGVTMIVQDS